MNAPGSGGSAVINPAKLTIVLALLACSTGLLAFDRLDVAVWVAINGPFVGLAIGNGINVARGQSPAPMIDTRPGQRRATDLAPPVAPEPAD